jgi:AcrR family transcriptional regulator
MGERLTAQQRKEQLVGIGLRLLVDTPLHEFSVDRVAEQAGISRSLLFHHFPTKREYYLAVVRAASRGMVHAVDVVPHDDPAAMIAALVAFVRRHRATYLAFVSPSGGDELVRDVNAETRAELVRRFARAAGVDDELGVLQVRGWIAYAEELVIAWTGSRGAEQDDALVVLLLTGLRRLLASAEDA